MRLRIKPWFDDTDKGMYKETPSFSEQELAAFLCALWGLFVQFQQMIFLFKKKKNQTCGYPVYYFLYVSYMIFSLHIKDINRTEAGKIVLKTALKMQIWTLSMNCFGSNSNLRNGENLEEVKQCTWLLQAQSSCGRHIQCSSLCFQIGKNKQS